MPRNTWDAHSMGVPALDRRGAESSSVLIPSYRHGMSRFLHKRGLAFLSLKLGSPQHQSRYASDPAWFNQGLYSYFS
jgi:hypothetical protein